jgi:ribosomal subunit interface protein
MDIVVNARRVELPDDLRASAVRKIERLNRFLAGMERAEVSFSDGRPGHLAASVTCEVVVEGHGHIVRASAAGAKPAVALEAAVDKAEHRLTRLKEKLVGRSRPRHRDGQRPAAGDAGGELDIDLEGITEL